MILDYINKQGGYLFTGDFVDVIYQLFLCYNLFLHIWFFPVNSVIIFKEGSLWIFNYLGLEVPTLEGAQLSYMDVFQIPTFFVDEGYAI